MTELFHTVRRTEPAADKPTSAEPCSSLLGCSDGDTGFHISGQAPNEAPTMDKCCFCREFFTPLSSCPQPLRHSSCSETQASACRLSGQSQK
ncbi:hypothetical protein EPR50_G00072010 [Perca flavescens]|uniref:Uncharacterized protein n=1 Tax=Perca flavescens TaxID=8167 RepID=A0A484D493_PERFV|nr:hypothetical protein EPR50_G00072010 [Perca flavescens]